MTTQELSNFRATEFLREKRDGRTHAPERIDAFVRGLVDGSVADYQASAWLMAAFVHGLDEAETAALTEAMWRHGESLPRLPVTSFRVDKHSTGGVGDKTSLLLVPWVLAAAKRLNVPIAIPMISGRGLGLTGGTLDKLESIPGYRTAVSVEEGAALLASIGGFVGGQTERTAPADRLLYALRDVTATVDHVSLITASILSKKLSASLDGLVLDVKFGEGAFMRDVETARRLAKSLTRVATANGLRTSVLLTAMDDVLGFAAGNALEVRECAEFLDGTRRSLGLATVTSRLAIAMLRVASPNISEAMAEAALATSLDDGSANAIFHRWIEAQGGDLVAARRDWADERRSRRISLRVGVSGPLRIPAGRIGNLLVSIGAGRARKEDRVQPEVGLWLHVEAGTPVREGDTIGWLAVPTDGDFSAVVRSAEETITAATALGEFPGAWVREEWASEAAQRQGVPS